MPGSGARMGVPIGAAMSMPLCDRPQRPPKPELTRPVTICTLSAAVPVVSVVRAVGGAASHVPGYREES